MLNLLSRLRAKPKKQDSADTVSDFDKMAMLTALLNDKSQPNLNALSILVRNIDLIALNIKTLGYDLARQMATALPVHADTVPRTIGLSSKLSTQTDLESDWVAHWCGQLRVPVVYHRKLWELAYILQAVYDSGSMRPGTRGLGFGCGNEPFGSYFASQGVATTITDLPVSDDRAREWSGTNQHASQVDAAYHSGLVDRARFDDLVRYRAVDMNAIPDDLSGYDFCWSMCAFEHLGSIEQGLAFVENSLKPLRPGGLAVHTTEFNVNAEGPTIDNWPTVLFQRRHFEELAERLSRQGHQVAPFDFDPGSKPLDRFIDLPPWHDGTLEAISRNLGQPLHLKVACDGFIATCFGLKITKGQAA